MDIVLTTPAEVDVMKTLAQFVVDAGTDTEAEARAMLVILGTMVCEDCSNPHVRHAPDGDNASIEVSSSMLTDLQMVVELVMEDSDEAKFDEEKAEAFADLAEQILN